MKYVALIGANGYIGSDLHNKLVKNKNLKITTVNRKNYNHSKKQKYDIVINCAMPSARFWAKNNPQEDFTETVQKTANIIHDWNYDKMIQISTISARTELNTVYGRHKAAAEALCDTENNLIIRLTSSYSATLKKGALIDILDGNKVYLDKKSRYSFANLDFISGWITNNLDKKGVVEIGARNSISLEEIVKNLKLNIDFEGPIDIQETSNPSPDFPNANEVISFMKYQLSKKSKE